MVRDKQQLKEKLMSTGYFVDNEYLEKYLELVCEDEASASRGCERHHILQKSYFKEHQLAIDNSDENLVRLRYRDHCLAHWYLYQCTCSKLKADNACAYRYMVNLARGQKLRWVTPEELELLQELCETLDREFFTDEFIEFIQTHSYAEIAETYQISMMSIVNLKHRLNLPVRKVTDLGAIDPEEFKLYCQSHTKKETAAYFQIGECSVTNLKKRLGIPMYMRPNLAAIDQGEFKQYVHTHTNEETSKHFHITRSGVDTLIKKFGIYKAQSFKRTGDIEAFKEYAPKHSLKEIANRFHLSYNGAYR